MKAFRLRLMSQALPFLLASPCLVAIPAIAYAQQAPTAAEAQAALNQQPPAQTYTKAQLDQMLAPIALYPDQVLMQVLMAATFPQQIIDAGNWLQDQNNAALKGDQLASALEPLPWDPSVKSLVAFPQIVVMMNEHMDWTQALGVAFASQQVTVMAEVQTLRNRAAAAGQLRSNAHIRYVHSGGAWAIEPVNPNEIYLPVYNPAVVYGRWEYPDYPPVYVPPPPDFVAGGYSPGPGIGFSVGFGVVAPLWGWGHPDWRRHEVVINQNRYSRITRTNYFTENHVAVRDGAWHRTAPVMTVADPPRRAAPSNAPRPEGTVAPAAIHAPPSRPGAEEHRPPRGEPGSEARPAPGTPRPGGSAQPAAGPAAPRPGDSSRPNPEAGRPGAPPHPGEQQRPGESAQPAAGPAVPHPGEPPRPNPEATRPGAPPHPGEAGRPTPGAAAPRPGESPRPTPEAAHPPESLRPSAAPHPAEHAPQPPPRERAAPPKPEEAPHPAPQPQAAHPAAPPPAPHPAPAASAPHPPAPPAAPNPAPAAAPPHPPAPPAAPHPAPAAAPPHPPAPPAAPNPASAAAPSHPPAPPPASHPAPAAAPPHPPAPPHPAPAPSSAKPEKQEEQK